MNQKQAKRIRRMAAAVAKNTGSDLIENGYLQNRNTGSIVVDPKSVHGLVKGLKKNLQGKTMVVQGARQAKLATGRLYSPKLTKPDAHPAPQIYADLQHQSIIAS